MVASIISAPQQLHRRRSLGSSELSSDKQEQQQQQQHSKSNTKMTAGFGSLLRRVGGSQRGMDDDSSDHQRHLPMGSQSERGLGSFLRKAKSLRGLDSSSHSLNTSKSRLDLEDEGPSGVASFLQQIDPPSEEPASPPQEEEEEEPKKQGNMFRGLIKRAASWTTNASKPPKKEQQLEPVLILTNENQGKVVFQNLDDGMDPAFGSSELGASLSDLASAATTTTIPSSPVKSKSFLSSSTHTTRTSVTARDSTLDDMDFSDRDLGAVAAYLKEEKPELEKCDDSFAAMDASTSSLTDRIGSFFRRSKSGRNLEEPPQPITTKPEEKPLEDSSDASNPLSFGNFFRRTNSGRIVIGGSSSNESATEPTDDSSGDCSEDSSSAAATEDRLQAPSSPSSLQEIALPCLVEEGEEEEEGLLQVIEEYDELEKATCCSTSSCEEESDDLDGYEEERPCGDDQQQEDYEEEGEDHQEEEEEEPPARVYDELELFYEEQTFEHVGGSLLLGAQSELMTVPEYDEENYDSEFEGEEEEYYESETSSYFEESDSSCFEGDNGSLMHSLLPVLEEEMDESYSSGISA